jgi:hypothetical protein
LIVAHRRRERNHSRAKHRKVRGEWPESTHRGEAAVLDCLLLPARAAELTRAPPRPAGRTAEQQRATGRRMPFAVCSAAVHAFVRRGLREYLAFFETAASYITSALLIFLERREMPSTRRQRPAQSALTSLGMIVQFTNDQGRAYASVLLAK